MPPAPSVLFENPGVKKVVADTTRRFYMTCLNKIATQGYPNIKALLDNQAEVVTYVKSQPGDRQKGFMNAIFYALSDHPNEHKKVYYNYFQELKKRDPRYVAYQASQAPAPAHAPAPAPAKPAKRKYTKSEKWLNQARFKKAKPEVKPEVKVEVKAKKTKKTKVIEHTVTKDILKKLKKCIEKALV